jgi:hypothetical protein
VLIRGKVLFLISAWLLPTLSHSFQFQHLQRTLLPVMPPAHNQITICRPVAVRQKIAALKFKFNPYPLPSVGREIPNSRHNCCSGFSRRLTATTNRILCSSTVHAAPCHSLPLFSRAVLFTLPSLPRAKGRRRRPSCVSKILKNHQPPLGLHPVSRTGPERFRPFHFADRG